MVMDIETDNSSPSTSFPSTSSNEKQSFQIGQRVEWSPESKHRETTKPHQQSSAAFEKCILMWSGAKEQRVSARNLVGIQFDYPRIFTSRWWDEEEGKEDQGLARRLFSSKAHYGGFVDKRFVQIDEDYTSISQKTKTNPTSSKIHGNFKVGSSVRWKLSGNSTVGKIVWLSETEINADTGSGTGARNSSSKECLCNTKEVDPDPTIKIQIAGILFNSPVQVSSSYFHHGKTWLFPSPMEGIVVELDELELQK